MISIWIQQLHAPIKRIPWFWFRLLLLLLSFPQTEKNVHFRTDRQQPCGDTGHDGILIMDMLSLNLGAVSIKQRKQQSAMHHCGLPGAGTFPPGPVTKIILVTSVYAAPILSQKKHPYSATPTSLQVHVAHTAFLTSVTLNDRSFY